MSTVEFTASVRVAFELSNKSRLSAGLALNKKPPRRYWVTLRLKPELYVELVSAAKSSGVSLTKYVQNELELRAPKRAAWLLKRRLNARLAA